MILRALEEELGECSLLVEDAILEMQRSCECGSGDFQCMLLQAELLIRDVVLLLGLEQCETGEAVFDDAISQAVVEIARATQDLADDHHVHAGLIVLRVLIKV